MNDAPPLAVLPAPRKTRTRRGTREPRVALDSSGSNIPRATYRLQLNGAFKFRDAIAIVPYLARLGVSHVYCSPYLRARPGSAHGYDVVDHGSINPEIGTFEELEQFTATLKAHGMGQLADIVPNHMGVLGGDNAWWLDVLENGPASQFADFFDIDWQSPSPELANRVLVPVLGDHYGVTLERGELKLAFEPEHGTFVLHYFDHRFPLDPREYPQILREATGAAGILAGEALRDLERLSRSFRALPGRTQRSGRSASARNRGKRTLTLRLARLARTEPSIAAAIEHAVASFNGMPGVPESFDKLDQLIDAQAYRLAYWRVASSEINYRRFFNVNELAAIRTENAAVFDATHGLMLYLLATGSVDGLRVDHPDGLLDPAAYFERLQARYRECTEGDSARRPRHPLYLVIEKIIAPFERVEESWAIYGTTGYRFASVVNGLFVDTAAQRKITRTYTSFIDDRTSFEAIAQRSKRMILRSELAAELTVLANQLTRIARADRKTRDYTFDALRRALAEVIAFFPVYRTYIAERASAVDKRYIDWAVARARRHSRESDGTIFDFVRSALLAEFPSRRAPGANTLVRAFVLRFQQLTAPVMAKAVEDTSFYIYNRLLSLNDVGGDPGTFGMTVRAFHGASLDRAKTWPHTLLATSTHDNKRSEDVRARIDVLSEMPAAWRLLLRRWSRMNRSRKQTLDGALVPSSNDEYLLYQTLIGSLPLGELDTATLADYRDRIEAYMLKAVREAKTHTSWINADEAYEAATTGFVRTLLAPERNPFLDSLRAAVAPIAWVGMLNSLSIVLIKLTSPGVPDIYQGNELWDYSLVDPDNRRPVDYALRTRLLDEIERTLDVPPSDVPIRVRALFDSPHDGRPKLFLTQRALALRRAHSALFRDGGYTALDAKGTRANHVVAYARLHAGAGIVVVAGRLYSGLIATPGELPCGERVWDDTWIDLSSLPDGTLLSDALTGRVHEVVGGRLPVADAFAEFPSAMLMFDSGDSAVP